MRERYHSRAHVQWEGQGSSMSCDWCILLNQSVVYSLKFVSSEGAHVKFEDLNMVKNRHIIQSTAILCGSSPKLACFRRAWLWTGRLYS